MAPSGKGQEENVSDHAVASNVKLNIIKQQVLEIHFLARAGQQK